MGSIYDILLEGFASPEAKKQYDNLYRKRRQWIAKGKDVSAIDAEMASLKAGNQPGTGVTTSTTAPQGPTKKPASSGKDWDEGYQAAIEAIKKAKSGKGQSGSGSGQGGDNGLEGIPVDPSDMDGENSENDRFNNAADQAQQSGGGSGQSRNGKKEGQGVVRPEDCMAPSGGELGKTPGAAGGMISKATGDKLAEAEGYDKEGGSEDSIEKEWKDRAQKAAQQMAGKGEGYERLKAKFDNLYKATKDWKKELKKIVGNSISPDEKRSAYANKNILISQDRVARTDKDRYDSPDYMMAWVDTSGSMSQEYLNQCLCEIYQVALAKKPMKLVIVQFDTRIADIQEFNSLADLKRKMNDYQIKGGGGTEVKPCFDLLLKDKKYARRPAELVMIFTDGYLDQYKRNPRTIKNLVWVVVDNLGFELKYKDINTKCVRLKSSDMGK